jgi:hypothetical protein
MLLVPAAELEKSVVVSSVVPQMTLVVLRAYARQTAYGRCDWQCHNDRGVADRMMGGAKQAGAACCIMQRHRLPPLEGARQYTVY